LTAPPDTAEPTKVKALNLPDEPDDEVDGAPTVNGDEPEEVEGINDGGEGSDDAKSPVERVFVCTTPDPCTRTTVVPVLNTAVAGGT